MGKSLEQALRDAAKRSGSMLQLSKRAELPYATIHGFIRDEKTVTLRSASKIADVLGLELRAKKRKGK